MLQNSKLTKAKGVAVSQEEQNQFKGITVADIQGLTKDDYSINEKKDAITLYLSYNYNKSYDNELLNYLAHDQKFLLLNELGTAVSNIWVFRYLIKLIKGKDLYQTFFVPVTTCRYPNQVAQIRVFPDMKWVLNFNFNIENPIYYKETKTELEYFERRKNEFDDLSGNIGRANESAEKKRQSSQSHLSKSGFGLSLVCEAGGEEPIEVSKAFSEKIRNTFGPIFTIIDFLDGLLGISKAKKEDHQQSSNPRYVERKSTRTIPVSFEINPPSLGLGIGIGYETTSNREISWGIEGRIIANPIIGANVRLDLLALGSKIKPWGIILDALDIAAWAAEALSAGRLEVNYTIEIVFESEINLVGKKTGEDPETKEPIFEKYGNLKYNFTERETIGDFNVQGILKGRIEMSASIRYKTKVKNWDQNVNNDKYEKKAELSIGVKASSYVAITVPTKLNENKECNVETFFSGLTIEFWFTVGFSSDNEDGDTKKKKIIDDDKHINNINF